MRRILALLLTSALFFAACSGGDSSPGPDPAEDPKGALTAAIEALGDYEGLTVVLSLAADAGSLTAISEGELTEEQAQAIVDSSVSFTGKEGDTPEDAQVEVVADIGGDKVELRVVGSTIYARADVRDLVARFGGDPDEIDAGMQGMPPQFGFLRAGVEGEWIGIEGAQEFAEQFGGATPSDEDMQLAEEMAEKLGQAVDESATVTSAGSDDVGERLEVELAIRPLAEAFIDIARSTPGGAALPPDAFDLSEVPDEQVPLDIWISDGRIRQIEVDFIEVARVFEADDPPEGVETFGLRVEIIEFTGDVSAPDAAETVNFGELMQTFMGGFGGVPGSEAPGTDMQPDFSELCDQLAGQPEEVVSQFAEECPELQQ